MSENNNEGKNNLDKKESSESKSTIEFSDFQKLEIKIGTIKSVERVPDTDKLYRLEVDFGHEVRQIVSGIADRIAPEDLVNTQSPFITNLAPRTIRGVESNGMIMAVGSENSFAILHPHQPVEAGATVR